MGSVWLAVDAILTRPVALKEPKGSESPPSDGRPGGNAVREARAGLADTRRTRAGVDGRLLKELASHDNACVPRSDA